MPRYFVAIPIPEEAKDRLIRVQPRAVSGMRLLGRDELHLTLHFIGEVAAQELDAVRAALATVKRNAFTVALRGIGYFPPEGPPQVLWAGVEANADLISLHRCVSAALTDAIGFRPEARPYSPHVTLARLNEPGLSDVIDACLNANAGFVLPSVPLDRFVLYSSEFRGGTPKYKEEAVLRFLGPARPGR